MRAFVLLIVALCSFRVWAEVPDRVPLDKLRAGLEQRGFDIRTALFEADAVGASPEIIDTLSQPNAYWLQLRRDSLSINVLAADANGILYGLEHARQLIEDGEARADILTAPGIGLRSLHIVVRSLSVDELVQIIDRARVARFNTLVLLLADGVEFEAEIVLPRQDAIPAADMRKLIEYAKASGLDVIPHLPLLTGQNHILKGQFPQLSYNSQTYDPRVEEVYPFVYAYIDEALALTGSSALHIGHDEVAGTWNKNLKPREQSLPAELFADHVERIHGYLKDRNVETWMWGDMLLPPDEFPDVKVSLNGVKDYAGIRVRIPKDIVICDWRYYHRGPVFPTLDAMTEEGRPVIGATWLSWKNV